MLNFKDEKHLIGSGYDPMINLYDIETNTLIQNFNGHTSSICSLVLNSFGNLIISGSKDCTIKFWDIRSGLCIKTFSQHFGEVTSIELNKNGTKLLSSSKDNSNRLWDLVSMKPIQRYKGHQNTYKNHLRATFGSNEQTIFGGSEDSFVYVIFHLN
jgi:COMPASS component SWD3